MISADQDTVLEQLTRVLVERFAPERIILFGSRGRGDHRPDSDYDLLMVMERPPDPGSLTNPVRDAVREVHSRVDVLVDTPERFERRRDDVGTMAYVAHLEGRVVYEREPGRPAQRVREDNVDPPESLAEWLERAGSDFTAMEALQVAAPDTLDVIAFHAHQAAEKMLKAALVARRVRPPRTHVLLELLSLASPDLRDRHRVRESCLELDKLWPNTRYPEEPMPTPGQVTSAVECAKRIRDAVNAARTS